MNIDWNKIFNKNYFLGLERGVLHRIDWAILFFGAWLVLVSIVVWFINRRSKNPVSKQFWNRLGKLFAVIGFLEAFWFLLRYENVQFFGARVTAIAFIVLGLIWLGFILKYYFSGYRVQKQSWEKEQVKLKYLQG